MTDMVKHCPYTHEDVTTLHGMTPPFPSWEELPKTCTCGAPITYNPDVLVFVRSSEFKEDIVEVTTTARLSAELRHVSLTLIIPKPTEEK